MWRSPRAAATHRSPTSTRSGRALPEPGAARGRAPARRAAAALRRDRVGRPADPGYRAASRATPRPVALGVVAAVAGLDDEAVALLALYDDAATVTSAALKLLRSTPPSPRAGSPSWRRRWRSRRARSPPTGGPSPSSPPPPRSRSSSPRRPTSNTRSASLSADRALRVGIGGPVGSGKSSLIAALCRELAGECRVGVVTNDIYTTEDAEFLRSTGVLPRRADRRGADRRLPAHRDPRRHRHQPRGRRASSRPPPARSTSCSSRAAATT